MYLRRVVLRNIKGFPEAELDLCPEGQAYHGWSVITGDNGSGKTAVLKAISMALLGPEQLRGLLQDYRGWVTESQSEGTISVEVKPNHDYDKTRKGGYPVKGTFWAEIGVERVDGGNLWDVVSADVFRNKKVSALNGPWSQGVPGWFTVGYGPFRRMYGSSPEAQRLMVIPGRIPKFATLFKEDATLGEGEEWVRQLNYKKLENNPVEAKVLSNLLDLVKDDFLREGVFVSEVNSEGLWLSDVAGRRMPLADMSEGYRSALAMLIDIYRHLVDVYGPNIVRVDSEGHHYVNRPGVVLIDEVDAHLHPAWQREIGFWFKRHFPKLQFIVTTHSPLVCQAADGGRIYHLGGGGGDQAPPFRLAANDYARVMMGRPDEILISPAFGLDHTRSPRAVSALARRAALLAKRAQLDLGLKETQELEQLDLFVAPVINQE